MYSFPLLFPMSSVSFAPRFMASNSSICIWSLGPVHLLSGFKYIRMYLKQQIIFIVNITCPSLLHKQIMLCSHCLPLVSGIWRVEEIGEVSVKQILTPCLQKSPEKFWVLTSPPPHIHTGGTQPRPGLQGTLPADDETKMIKVLPFFFQLMF